MEALEALEAVGLLEPLGLRGTLEPLELRRRCCGARSKRFAAAPCPPWSRCFGSNSDHVTGLKGYVTESLSR